MLWEEVRGRNKLMTYCVDSKTTQDYRTENYKIMVFGVKIKK